MEKSKRKNEYFFRIFRCQKKKGKKRQVLTLGFLIYSEENQNPLFARNGHRPVKVNCSRAKKMLKIKNLAAAGFVQKLFLMRQAGIVKNEFECQICETS